MIQDGEERARDPVERALDQYLEALERDAETPVEAYRDQLESTDERARFDRLLSYATAEPRLAEPPSLAVGQRVAGRYLLLGELGEGGMGKVYRARDEVLEREVALKALLPQWSQMTDRARFETEAKVLGRLEHPNIVFVHDARLEGDFPYIVMDLVDGVPADRALNALAKLAEPSGAALASVIGRTPAAGTEDLLEGGAWDYCVARMLAQIAAALEASHESGVLHRDIKPRNIMLRGGGQPVVLDFGLAGSLDPEITTSQGLFGSPAYLAPEQLAGGATGADPHTDQYQLGLVLYEFLTLHRAFQGDSFTDIIRRIEVSDFPWPRDVRPSVGRELEAICLKTLAHEPHHRYESLRALREDLERFLWDEPILARSPGLPGRIRLWTRRHPAWTAALASVFLAALVLGWLSSKDPPPAPPEGIVHTIALRAGSDTAEAAPTRPLAPRDHLGLSYDLPEDAAVRLFVAIYDPQGRLSMIAPSRLGQELDGETVPFGDGELVGDYVLRVEAGEGRVVYGEELEDFGAYASTSWTEWSVALWLVRALDVETLTHPSFELLERIHARDGHQAIPLGDVEELLRSIYDVPRDARAVGAQVSKSAQDREYENAGEWLIAGQALWTSGLVRVRKRGASD